ncbi:MAG: zinc-ribbon domain-containing protein [Candidatus Hodarchaeota archaeon]
MFSCQNCGTSVSSNDLFCQACGIDLMKIQSSQFTKQSDRTNEYRGYIQILGYVEMVFGVLSLVISLFTVIIAVFIPLLMIQGIAPNDLGSSTEVVAVFIGIIVFIVALLFLIFGIAQIVYGRRLLQYKNSGRIGTIVTGVLHLINIPFGTAYGLAALFILTRPEAIYLFED